MFGTCKDKKCKFGHVILKNKLEYLKKLMKFDQEYIEKTSQTFLALDTIRMLINTKDCTLRTVEEFINKQSENKITHRFAFGPRKKQSVDSSEDSDDYDTWSTKDEN
jgi:hypothetical protein